MRKCSSDKFNTLGRGLLGDATKTQGSRPRGFRQEDCFMFSLYKSLQNT